MPAAGSPHLLHPASGLGGRVVGMVPVALAAAAGNPAAVGVGRLAGSWLALGGFALALLPRVLLAAAGATLVAVGVGGVPGHGSAILLVALVGRVLLDVPLTVLLREVGRRRPIVLQRGVGRLVGAGRAARTLGAAARGRDRRRTVGHGCPRFLVSKNGWFRRTDCRPSTGRGGSGSGSAAPGTRPWERGPIPDVDPGNSDKSRRSDHEEILAPPRRRHRPSGGPGRRAEQWRVEPVGRHHPEAGQYAERTRHRPDRPRNRRQ